MLSKISSRLESEVNSVASSAPLGCKQDALVHSSPKKDAICEKGIKHSSDSIEYLSEHAVMGAKHWFSIKDQLVINKPIFNVLDIYSTCGIAHDKTLPSNQSTPVAR